MHLFWLKPKSKHKRVFFFIWNEHLRKLTLIFKTCVNFIYVNFMRCELLLPHPLVLEQCACTLWIQLFLCHLDDVGYSQNFLKTFSRLFSKSFSSPERYLTFSFSKFSWIFYKTTAHQLWLEFLDCPGRLVMVSVFLMPPGYAWNYLQT